MIILGIDPGTKRMGYGVIRREKGKESLIDAGILGGGSADTLAAFKEIRTRLLQLIATHRPEAMAIEKLFFAKNRKTAMVVAEARGIAISAALDYNLPLVELAPNEIKLAIAGYGGATKEGVARMVRLILREPTLRVIDDASDALAIALCAAQSLKGKV